MYLTVCSDQTNTPITSDDGAPPADIDGLCVRWQTATPPFPKVLTLDCVDPENLLFATTMSAEITTGSVGKLGCVFFGELRSKPGQWKVFVHDLTGLVAALPFDVNTIPPDGDSDDDGVPNDQDNCPNHANPLQENSDGDIEGDACDSDDDNDGHTDDDETTCGSDPLNAASLSADYDSDGVPDCVDPDDDNDEVVVVDAFPFDSTESSDNDGMV